MVARYDSEGSHFEVLIDPHLAQKMRDGEDVDIEKLMATLFYRVGNYRKAFDHFRSFLDSENSQGNDYERCALAYYKLRADGIQPEEIAGKLASFFEEGLVRQVAADLADPEKAMDMIAAWICSSNLTEHGS